MSKPNPVFDLAKEIRQPGEKWHDAVKRASAQINAQKEKNVKPVAESPAPEVVKAESPATAPTKIDGKWSVSHNGEVKQFDNRHDASRYYREHRQNAVVEAAEANSTQKKPKAEAPVKVEGKWSVLHNGETLAFPTRKKAARYYRENR